MIRRANGFGRRRERLRRKEGEGGFEEAGRSLYSDCFCDSSYTPCTISFIPNGLVQA